MHGSCLSLLAGHKLTGTCSCNVTGQFHAQLGILHLQGRHREWGALRVCLLLLLLLLF